MAEKKPSPLQAAFWLTPQEKKGILVVCVIVLLGLAARHFYLKNASVKVYTPAGIEEVEQGE